MEAMVRTPVGSGILRTPLLGPGNVANVLAAIAVAFRFQVPLGAMLTAVGALEPQPRRGKVVRLRDVTLVDDSYNSNPTALRLTLEAVGRESRGARRVAVLGEMLELGPSASALHAACGRAAVAAGFEFVIAVGGSPARALADATREAGLPASAVVTCATSTEAADVAQQHVRAGDLVLIKGSRGVGMDVVVDRLKTTLA
jgi:UDP-N-acetylmuramoyl-tripeptide--D-alanyl-D-alanine ligase